MRGMMHVFRSRTAICMSLKGSYHKNTVLFCQGPKKMADIKTVLNYDDMVKAISQPDLRFVVDVRNADEVANTGMIPSSINIPLDSLTDVLCCMSEEEFRHKFQRHKPTVDDEIIFYCQSGRRASKAFDTAVNLGYTNSKTYAGSWKEWSEKR